MRELLGAAARVEMVAAEEVVVKVGMVAVEAGVIIVHNKKPSKVVAMAEMVVMDIEDKMEMMVEVVATDKMVQTER